MIHHLVAGIMQRLDRFGIFIHPFANHKEGGFDIVLCQNINNLLSIFIAPRRIKGDGRFPIVAFDRIDRQTA